jgi:hypothetical protein
VEMRIGRAHLHAGDGTLQASVPFNMVQEWMGHARIGTTAYDNGEHDQRCRR